MMEINKKKGSSFICFPVLSKIRNSNLPALMRSYSNPVPYYLLFVLSCVRGEVFGSGGRVVS